MTIMADASTKTQHQTILSALEGISPDNPDPLSLLMFTAVVLFIADFYQNECNRLSFKER